MFPKHFRLTLAVIAGIFVGAGIALYYYLYVAKAPAEEEVHVHADFLVYINDRKLDLTNDKYQSSAEQVLAPDFHLHDNKDNIIHRHADGLTLSDFMSSLGFTLTNICLLNDAETQFCSNEKNILLLYVNDSSVTDIESYVPQDGDHILLYYGDKNLPYIDKYLSEVTDEACIYSGKCPERGLPPPESCGLTCEI